MEIDQWRFETIIERIYFEIIITLWSQGISWSYWRISIKLDQYDYSLNTQIWVEYYMEELYTRNLWTKQDRLKFVWKQFKVTPFIEVNFLNYLNS